MSHRIKATWPELQNHMLIWKKDINPKFLEKQKSRKTRLS
jgi:hypothetical protein